MKKILSVLLISLSIYANAQIGNTNNGTLTDSIGQYINVTVAQASSTITSTNLNVKVLGITGRYKFAVYSGTATGPSTFIVGSSTITNPVSGWYSVSIPSTTFTNGQYYWLASWSDNSGAQIYYTAGNNTRWESSARTFGTWPTTLTMAAGGAAYNYSIYIAPIPTPTNSPTTTRTVTLAWDANCDSQVIGYRVYWSTNVTTLVTNVVPAYVDDCGVSQPQKTNTYHLPYPFSTPSIGGRTNCTLTISNLIPSVTYAFAVTSTNSVGLESDYSSEVTFTVPSGPQPPTALKFP